MKKFSQIILCMVLAAVTLLSGCTSAESTKVEVQDASYYNKFKDKNIEINVYNWGEYISNGSDDSLDINKAFEQVSGIKVNYTQYATNEELRAKLKSGAVNYDIIIPSDYMIGRMINENMLEKLDFKNIPNYSKIDDEFKSQIFDPKNEYSVPYTWGTVGLIYNKKFVDANDVNSWNALWNEKYSGKMLMFSNSRDAIAIALKKLGFSYNTTSDMEIRAAAEELKKQKPLVQAYVMDEIFDKMVSGEAILAPYYAGDAITMINDNPDLDFAFPKEGTNKFIDSMCIPKNSKNKESAEAYINFMLETQVGKSNIEFIGYSTPNKDVLASLADETKNSKISYPSKDVLSKTEVFLNLPEETNKLYDSLWTEILGKN